MKITFGKYKNQELKKVYDDSNYKDWLLKQHFFKNKYKDQYDFLKNYKPLSKINFTDLPGDIKSLIFGINYNAEKSAHEKQIEYEKENGITKNGKKGRKQIVSKCVENCDSYYADTPRFRYTDELRYINCANCGNALHYNGGGYNNQQAYECCSRCYDKFRDDARKRREEQQKQLQFCLISDSEDED
jgi:hypothetical protein